MLVRPRRRRGGSPHAGRQRGGMASYTPVGAPPQASRLAPLKKPVAPVGVKPIAAKPVAPVAPVAPPPTAQGNTLRANAWLGLEGANNTYRDSVFRAAMALGDPTVLAKLAADPTFKGYSFVQDPNSQFATLGRNETEGLRGIDESSNANNAFFSGYRLNDRNLLSADIGRQRSGASTDYLGNLSDFGSALAGAQGDFRQGMSDADLADIDYATSIPPTNRQPKPKPKAKATKPEKKKPRKKKHKMQTYKPSGKKPRKKSKLEKL